MCGICGVYHFAQSNETEHTLKSMLNRMVHRGPDDEGMYQSGPVGLGMRRLSIIDTHGGHQPISNEDGSVWVVLNGEIYNYIELREQLEKNGHTFQTLTDTEVLVHLYEEKGIDAVYELNGMFAFAIYDRNREALWIVRDRLGIKPLFYALNSNGFYFSSDLNSMNSVIKSSEIDQQAFVSYLAFAYVSNNKSIIEDINKVPPGHWMWIDAKGVKTKKYWDIDQFQTWKGSAEEAEVQLQSLLESAIQLQLRSDVPVGISLSGGMDSSAITAIATKYNSNLTTFTIDFIGKRSYDTIYSRQLAEHLGTSHIEIGFSSNELSRYLDELIPFIDEPISDSAAISSYLIAKKAQQNGIKVLLTGAGGDEIFGGYLRHHYPVKGSTQWLAETIPKPLRFFSSLLMNMLNKDKSFRMQDPRIAFGAGYSGANLEVLFDLFNDKNSFRKMVKLFVDQLTLSPERDCYHYTRMYTDLKHYLVDDVLALSDKTTMASSVEGRVPLLDHRLVEFAFSMLESVNMFQNKPKGLFRKTITPLLPNGFLDRKKEGFNAPMFSWASDPQFYHVIEHELLNNTIVLYKEMFDLSRMASWVQKVKKGHVAAETIYNLYFFSRWYRHHMEMKV